METTENLDCLFKETLMARDKDTAGCGVKNGKCRGYCNDGAEICSNCKKCEKRYIGIKASIEEILEEVGKQIEENGDNHVDLIIDNYTNVAFIMYHSRHDSHVLIDDDYDLVDIDIAELVKRAEDLNYSVCDDN